MFLPCVLVLLALCAGVTPSKPYDDFLECVARCMHEFKQCAMCPGMSIVMCESTQRFCLETCTNMRPVEDMPSGS